jgi:hypothetical protein
VTPRADEIQRLITDLDNLLATTGKRLPRLMSNQTQEARPVLERIRDFLTRLEESAILDNSTQNKIPGQQPLSPLLAKFVEGNIQSSPQHQQPDEKQSSAAAPQQLNTEFAALIQSLRAELAGLMQERTNLVQEIKLLEQRRSQNYSLTQQLANQEQVINEFLQVLMNRLVPSLTPHLAPSSTNSANTTKTNPTPSTTPPFSATSDHTERLSLLTRDLDQRLVSLDGTVNVVFEALQRNINTYHESLSQALARMHSQGLQGEQLMASFFQNLTHYLQQQSPDSQTSLLGTDNEKLHLQGDRVFGHGAWDMGNEEDYTNAQSLSPPANFHETLPGSTLPKSPETPPALTINDELKDIFVTDDLDAVFLQLDQDAPLGIQIATGNIQPHRLDEVDQLYASLFGTDYVTDSRPEAPLQVVTDELSVLDQTSPLVLNVADTPSAPPSDQVAAVDGAAKVPDPWLEESEAEILAPLKPHSQEIQDAPAQPTESLSHSWEALFFEEDEEDSEPVPPLDLSILPPTEVAKADSFPTQLASADTITALTDLLTDFGQDQQPLVVLSPEAETKDPTTTTTVAEGSAVVINDQEPDSPLDNYILASPQENLLTPAVSLHNTVADISLDEVQLQQLELDLANLDDTAGLAAESQQEFDPENDPKAAFPWLEIPQLDSTSFPQPEVELDFSPAIEKTKEVISPSSDSSVLSLGNHRGNPEVTPFDVRESVWYLGIDLGTTGISAAVLNRSNFVVYPIYWSAETQAGVTFQQSFRLPAEVYLPTASVPPGEVEGTEAVEQSQSRDVASEKVPEAVTNNLYSAQLKPYLQVAIPYKNAGQKWEPVLQFNEFSAGPLIWVVRSLSKLLSTLKSDRQSTTQGLTAAAMGLDETTFSSVINNIAGVICTCPTGWSEQYRFNFREALLTSKIVSDPQQVFFIEEAIASLLGVLDGANGETIQLSDFQGLTPAKNNDQPIVGSTLAINIGATATEMALVDLPESLVELSHQDFMLHSFTYAGKGIEQDIICQLLLPPKSRQLRSELQDDSKTITGNPRHWQPSIPGLDQMHWQSLGLEELELPRVGEPDLTARIRLQQRLESSLLGQAVLDAALALKLILQHQDSFTLDLADYRWVLERRDLESQVLVPFVRRLNRELNKLLVARGIPTEAINQAILTGGVASIGTVNRWLRQKLPNAKIIQDLYLAENGAPNCSRVAYGLAMLPLHPQVLDIPRQQYTDYFLFTELLRLLPDRSLSFSEVLQLFEGHGINTRTCQQRLLAFLEGELPPGLIPNSIDFTWLTLSSHENLDYQAIAAAPLFEKQGSLTYRPNSQQLLSLRHYLDAIQASTQQSLAEPYTINFALEVDH